MYCSGHIFDNGRCSEVVAKRVGCCGCSFTCDVLRAHYVLSTEQLINERKVEMLRYISGVVHQSLKVNKEEHISLPTNMHNVVRLELD